MCLKNMFSYLLIMDCGFQNNRDPLILTQIIIYPCFVKVVFGTYIIGYSYYRFLIVDQTNVKKSTFYNIQWLIKKYKRLMYKIIQK